MKLFCDIYMRRQKSLSHVTFNYSKGAQFWPTHLFYSLKNGYLDKP